MTDTATSPSTTSSRSSRLRTIGRWMVTFTGFPLGGFAAELLVGPVDGRVAALIGGLMTGAFIGAVQWWGLGSGHGRPAAAGWIAATAMGFMVGLGIGAAAVGYNTGLESLVIQGAICGLAVGIAQALVLRPRLGRLALAWPPALAAIWAIGWAVTTSVGVRVDLQFTVFGSAGAIVVTALTVVLPLSLNRQSRNRQSRNRQSLNRR